MLDQLEHQSPTAFVVAGVVMVVGLVVEGLLTVVGVGIWPWMVAAGIAVSMGLLGLYPQLKADNPRLARTGAAFAAIAGGGASIYVIVMVSFRVADQLAL